MATWYYDALLNGLNVDPAEAALRAGHMTRDKNRTPNQWANSPNGGFCPADATPWLPVNPNYAEGINVQDQQADPDSLLNYYKRLIQIRKRTPALLEGEYLPLHLRARTYFAFLRKTPEQTVLAVLNYSNKRRILAFDLPGKTAHPLLSTTPGKKDEHVTAVHLSPFEVLIAELV